MVSCTAAEAAATQTLQRMIPGEAESKVPVQDSNYYLVEAGVETADSHSVDSIVAAVEFVMDAMEL